MSDVAPPSEREEEYLPVAERWLIAFTVMFGAFLAVMDVSIVNVALPHMRGAFGSTLSEITWVATAYSIAEIIMATMAGWWSTMIGRKRLYVLSLVVFTVGSALAGLSQSFWQMLAFRTIQGVGGGALIPLSMAILQETFPPEERSMAMSIYGMGVVLAPALGPVVGGWLTDHLGWPWIFYVNAPFSIFGVFMANAFVQDPHYLRRGLSRIDGFGIALLALGLTGMQLVLERGQHENWLQSNWIVAGILLTVVAFVLFVRQELRVEEPVIDVRLLKNLPLSTASAIGLVLGIGLYGSTFLLPSLVQNLFGYPAYDAGLVLLPRGAVMFFMMPIVGWLYNRLDARLLVACGLGFMATSFFWLAGMAINANFWSFVPPLVIMGFGLPFAFVTLTTVSVSTIPREAMTHATSVYTLSRRVGGNIGYALLATVVERRSQFHHARLVAHVTPYDPGYGHTQAQLASTLIREGVPPTAAPHLADGLIGRFVNDQSTMMAYNDAAWLVAMMFVLFAPLALLLPARRRARRDIGAATSPREAGTQSPVVAPCGSGRPRDGKIPRVARSAEPPKAPPLREPWWSR